MSQTLMENTTTAVAPADQAKHGFWTRTRIRLAGFFAALTAFVMPGASAFAAGGGNTDPLGGATTSLVQSVTNYIPVVLVSVISIAVAIIGLNILFKLVRKALSAA